MVYPASFHRLVLIGTMYTETFNTTMSIVHETGAAVDLPAVSDTLLTGVATTIGDWWNNALSPDTTGGLGSQVDCKLTSIKLNRIGEDGLYQDPDTKEYIYSSPIAGGGSAAHIAPQLALVTTLRGGAPRSHASKGRMYWPPNDRIAAGVGTDGRLFASDALSLAHGIRNFVTRINDAYATAGFDAVAGIASRAGSGAFQVVESVSVGRVVDTMRSRRNKLSEDPQTLTI